MKNKTNINFKGTSQSRKGKIIEYYEARLQMICM